MLVEKMKIDTNQQTERQIKDVQLFAENEYYINVSSQTFAIWNSQSSIEKMSHIINTLISDRK